MPYYNKIYIRNKNPEAITWCLRKIGRERYKEKMERYLGKKPRFRDIFIEIEQDTCYMMAKGLHHPSTMFCLDPEEVPVFGWEVLLKRERRKKK